MAVTPPLLVPLRRVILVTVKAGVWRELAAIRHRQWDVFAIPVLATGFPVAVAFSLFLAVVMSGGPIASVLFGVAANLLGCLD